ncbi:hypothetical protein BpHYR1_021797 [Brachionus plicatilis]|uniref:Uncharacterized protein n=1 Tax=Brachionus plicatilis TaxID=10195 RepID=A0A3M7RMV4_BRAPC|nr:hypothetical protein BpHYR1_021797 [Brachionus plicatilis]
MLPLKFFVPFKGSSFELFWSQYFDIKILEQILLKLNSYTMLKMCFRLKNSKILEPEKEIPINLAIHQLNKALNNESENKLLHLNSYLEKYIKIEKILVNLEFFFKNKNSKSGDFEQIELFLKIMKNG